MIFLTKQVFHTAEMDAQIKDVAAHDAHYALKQFLPITELVDVQSTLLSSAQPDDVMTELEMIFFPVFSEITTLGALNPQQLVGLGEALKRVIDFRGMKAVEEKLEQLARDYPINFVIAAGEGLKDESHGLFHGDVFYSQDPDQPIRLSKYPKFVKRLQALNIPLEKYEGIKPFKVEVIVDVIDATGFTSKGAHRGTSMITLAFVIDGQKYALKVVPDQMSAYVRAVAKGIKNVDTRIDRPVKDFVQDVAEAIYQKNKKSTLVPANENTVPQEYKDRLHQHELEEIKKTITVSIMNRSHNMYLVQEYINAGVLVDRDEKGEILWKRSKTKGKEHNMISGNISLVGDGNITCVIESMIMEASSGSTEAVTVSHLAESIHFLLVSKKKLKAYEKNIPELINGILQLKENSSREQILKFYDEDDVQTLNEHNYSSPKDYAVQWSKKDLINSDTVMTFISAITPHTGKHEIVVSGQKHNIEAYPGVPGMNGVTIDNNYQAQVSTIGVGSGSAIHLMKSTYKTRATFFNEKFNDTQRTLSALHFEVAAKTASTQTISKYQEVILNMGVLFRNLLLSYLRLGLIAQADTTLSQLEEFLKQYGAVYEDAIELKAWIEEFKSYQRSLHILKRAVNPKLKMSEVIKLKYRLNLLKKALKQLKKTETKFQILRFEDYLLEISTLEVDVKDQITKIQAALEKAKKQ